MKRFNWVVMTLIVVSLFGFGQTLEASTPTIVHWKHASPATDKLMVELAREFEQTHDVKIEIVVTPLADYYTKLLPALAAGSGPDVFNLRDVDVPRYRDFGVIQPLITDHEKATQEFVAGTIGYLMDEGGILYGFPTGVQTVTLFYNTEIFEAAGIEEIPETWDELIRVAQQLTKYDENGMMIQSGLAHGDYGPVIWSFLSQGTEEWLSEDGKALFNTPEVLEAFTFVTDWITKYKVESYDFGSRWSAFRDQSLAMVMAHPGMLGSFRTTHPDLPFGIAEIPTKNKDDVKKNVQTSWAFVVSANTKHPEFASEWLAFLSSEKVQRRWTTETGTLPSRYSLVNDSLLLEEEPLLAAPLKSVEVATRYPFEAFSRMEKAIEEAIQRVTISGQTPQQALDWLAKEAEKAYKEVILEGL